jgi:hypothetical protein
MSKCDVNALAAAGPQWSTADRGSLAVIRVQLLCLIFTGNPMVSCDKNALMALAAANGYEEADPGTLSVLQTALLAQIAKTLNPTLDISANGLMANAGCFACQDPGVNEILQTQLLCEINAATV